MVRHAHVHPSIDPRLVAAAEWEDTERDTRTAFAVVRFRNMEAFEARHPMTPADRFDTAYAIWDDYIRDYRHDEQDQSPADHLANAQVFARLVPYLSGRELVALAIAAWGVQSFDARLMDDNGQPVGLLSWSASQERIVVDYPGKRYDCTNAGTIAVLGEPAVWGASLGVALQPWQLALVTGTLDVLDLAPDRAS